MYSVQNTPSVLFPSLFSAQNLTEKKSDAKTETLMIERAAVPGSDVSTLNHALAKADALGQALSPTSFSGTQRDERVLATQQFENSLRGVANSDTRLTPEQKDHLQTGIDSVVDKAPSLMRALAPQPMAIEKKVIGQTGDEYPVFYKTIEDKVLWEKTASAIGQIGKEYLGVYENVVGKYTDFYKSFSDILSKMGSWISAGKDGNKVKLNITALKTALESLKNHYALPNKGAVLFPEQSKSSGVKGATEAEAKQWAGELGLPDTCVKKLIDGTSVVVIDLAPVDAMISEVAKLGTRDAERVDGLEILNSLHRSLWADEARYVMDSINEFTKRRKEAPDKEEGAELLEILRSLQERMNMAGVSTSFRGRQALNNVNDVINRVNKQRETADKDENVELDNAKFQAWQSGFKAQEENLKNTLQTFTQKYSNANSLYDNLVKVLSSTISSCVETAKSFLHG